MSLSIVTTLQNSKTGLATLIATSLLLGACGGTKSNPVADYQDVVSKQSIPADQVKKADAQNLITADFYLISADGDQFQRDLIFREGESTSHTLTVRLLLKDVKYELKWTDAPAGASLVPIDGQADTYKMTWAVPVLTLSPNETARPIPMHIQLNVLPGTSPASANVLAGIDNTWALEAMVLPSKTAPTVAKIGGVDSPVAQGEDREITVDVTDAASGNKIAPVMTCVPGALDTRRADIDGCPFLRVKAGRETAESLGGGAWRFHYALDTTSVSGGGKSTSLQMTFQAYSRSGLASAGVITHVGIQTKADTAAPAPTTSKPAVKPTAKKKA